VGIPTETVKAWAAAADCAAPAKAAINAELRRGGKGGRTANVRPPTVRGMVGGDKPASVFIPGLRVVNPLNGRSGRRMNRWDVKRLNDHQADMVQLFVGRVSLPAPPVRVRLVRVYAKGRRPMDSDGLAAAFKKVQDSVAALLGVDDGDAAAVAWERGQEAGEAGVRVEIRKET
jgi:hypothetical protein